MQCEIEANEKFPIPSNFDKQIYTWLYLSFSINIYVYVH